MRGVLIAIGLVLATLIALVLWAGSGDATLGSRAVEPIEVPRSAATPAELTPTSTLTVVSWNIAWGFGWGSEYRQRVAEKSADDLDRALSKMAAELVRVGADVALLQEVDLGAARSFGVDQARLLAERTGLRYAAPIVSWDLRYLPFPYWPPARHVGRIRSGGAILSRWPLEDCWGELLDKPAGQPFWYRPFYLFRYVQGCTVRDPRGPFEVWNVHLEAFDLDNRQDQARTIAERLSAKPNPARIFGGDLNTAPPEASVRHGYPDEPESDHRNDSTLQVFRALADLRPALTSEELAADPAAAFTFPAHAPNRMLDHLFFGPAFERIDARVDREAGDPSDHLPLVLRLKRAP